MRLYFEVYKNVYPSFFCDVEPNMRIDDVLALITVLNSQI